MAEPPLKQGTIVIARVVPLHGKPKNRPAVLCTADASIPTAAKLLVVGISTSYHEDDADCIPLPTRPDGQTQTRLTKPCAICLDLIDEVGKADIVPTWGYVSKSALAELLSRLRELGRDV